LLLVVVVLLHQAPAVVLVAVLEDLELHLV
jgi:hypothetical protein